MEDKYLPCKETVEFIDFVILSKQTYKDVYADDKKVTWGEYLTIIKAAYDGKNGIIGIEKVPSELAVTSNRPLVIEYFKAKYDDPNDELEALVEDTLDWLNNSVTLEQRWAAFLSKK